MPVTIKPLFRPEAFRTKLASFILPARCQALRPKLTDWAKKLSSGKLDKKKETELLPDFLTDLFAGILGYTGPVSGSGFDAYTMKREALVEVDGKRADAAFGRFGIAEEKTAVVLEGKGPRDVLDRPFAGRPRSAVEQALLYALNLRLDWYIVTNLKEIRLYSKQADQFTFERFEIGRLAHDADELCRFVFLLGAERVLSPEGKNHLEELFTESKKIGRELTNKFYGEYRELRQQTFDALRKQNPGRDPNALLSATQKLLDRILFIAFCEDRELLPRQTIAKAFQHKDPYNPRPVWENFKGLFKAVDEGNPHLEINQYNGKLYAMDAFLDSLAVPDAICEGFKKLADYEYGLKPEGEAKLIDVEILGHVFEQSISDLEEMQNVLAGKIPEAKLKEHKRSARKETGAFYTPAFITHYLVKAALGPVLEARFDALKAKHIGKARGKAKKALEAPAEYVLEELTEPEKKALTDFWGAWLAELETIRILDPACGSGAFLLEAFDQMFNEYRKADGHFTELGGKTLFDIRRAILEHNLFGVDLNEAAEEGKKLTSLDHNFRHGNSVVNDPAVHPDAFDWHAEFPEVFAEGGFDVVLGNPPYVRQEWIKEYKAHFEKRFPAVYSGTADLYVYFYALGHELLKPGGRLGFISSNSFARAGFAGPLRKFLTTECRMEKYIDLGDTVTFSDAKDVYPAIVVLSKAKNEPTPSVLHALRFKREDRGEDIEELLETRGIEVATNTLDSGGWRMDAADVVALGAKVRNTGRTLASYPNGAMFVGVKTALNQAFVIDDAKRQELIESDPRSAELIKPFVQGTNLREWHINDSGEYLLAMKSSENKDWPWSTEGTSHEMEFEAAYPAVYAHLCQYREACIKRSDQGRFWWELRSCSYWNAFEQPKIIWPDITKSPRFSMDTERRYLGNTGYIIPGGDYYLLGVLNSQAIWFALTSISIPFGERAGEFRYRLIAQYMEKLPIPDAPPAERDAIAKLAEACNTLGTDRYRIEEQVRHRLLTSFRTDPEGKLNEKAQEWWELDFMALGEALKTSFKRKQNPFTAPQTADEWEPYYKAKRAEVDKLRRKLADAEEEINERVYRLFNLTAEETALLKREVEH
jgi:type I restriction-modification system DNA methylase subunit